MKKMAYGFLGLCVLIVAAALIVPGFIDWNGYKTEISAEVRKATGRTLEITGDLEFAVLPAPRLRISGARLSNVAGATAAHMMSLRELRVSVALLPLLRGDIEIGHVDLIEPVIELEKLPDGRMNWAFTPYSAGSAGSATRATPQQSAAPANSDRKEDTDETIGRTGTVSAFRLDALSIQNGTIVYRDTASATVEWISELTADLSAGSLAGPFKIDGGLTVRNTPLTIAAEVRRFVENGAVPFRLTLGTPATKAEVELSGTVTDLETKPSISAQLNGKASSLGAVIASLTGAAPVPQLRRSFAMTATVAGSYEQIAVNNLTVQLGESGAEGNIKVRLRDGLRADIALRMTSLDVDALMAVPANPAAAQAPPSNRTTPSRTGGRPSGDAVQSAQKFALPRDIEANIDLTVNEVVAMRDRVRALRLAASLKDGRLMLNSLTAGFPGATELSVSGELTAPDGALNYAGKTTIRSTNLRRFLGWAGVDVAAVPADRLRRFNVSADVSGNSEQIQAAGIVAQLDASRMSGGVTIAFRDRAAFGASLSIDQINADAYLGEPAPIPEVTSGTAAPANTPVDPKPVQQPAPGPRNPLAILNDFDANLTFRIGSLSYRRMAVQGVRLDGTLVNGLLTLRDASVRDLAGTSAKVAGELSGFQKVPTFKGTIAAASNDLSGLFKIAGIASPVTPRKLGKLRLTGRANAAETGLTLDANLELAEVKAKVSGSVSGLKGGVADTLAIDLSIDAQHPELARLVNLFDNGKPGPSVGRIGAKMTVKGDQHGVSVNLNGGAAGSAFKVGGTIDTPLDVPKLDIDAEISHPDLVKFVRVFDRDFKPANSRLGGLSMAAKLAGTENDLEITGLTGKIGPTRVSGEGTYRAANAGAARPDIELSLVTTTIPLSDFLEAPSRNAGQPPSLARQREPGSPARNGGAGKPGGQRWSTDTIDTAALGLVDANIDLRAQAVLYKTFRIDQPKVVAVLKDNVLDVQRVAGKMFDGGFEMRAKVDGRGVPVATTSMAITRANVGKALFQAAEFDIATGILSFGMDLSARGKSQRDMIKALTGKGKIDVIDGVVKGFDLKRASENLKNINQLAGLLGVLASAMEGGETKFSSLEGTFDITKGIMITNDLRLVADAGEGNARGFVNLPKWTMDMNADFRMTEHPTAPPFIVRAVGPPDNPRRLIDFQALQAWMLQRGIGGLIQNLVPNRSNGGGSQQQPQQPKPEDIIRGLLKGLGR